MPCEKLPTLNTAQPRPQRSLLSWSCAGKSRSPSLTKRIAASGNEIGSLFSHTFQSKSPARFILCAACGSVVLLSAARVFDYFVVIETAFMDNQAQITETISLLDSEKVR